MRKLSNEEVENRAMKAMLEIIKATKNAGGKHAGTLTIEGIPTREDGEAVVEKIQELMLEIDPNGRFQIESLLHKVPETDIDVLSVTDSKKIH